MAHLALYREFRPQRFADVVGQPHITRTLRNALIQNRLHHAYLLSGPRGTGKTTVARILARAVNCLNPQDGEPCNECNACRGIITGETMDVIEIDAASNRGIEEIRDLRDKVKYAPADLQFKVYIIDEVHMLSEPAFNALLKTLEEPPAHVLFVLATTEKHKLPVTIVSRCQCFDYHRLATPEIINRLCEVCQAYNFTAAPEAMAAIARQAEGGMRDALSLLDQVMAYSIDGQITVDDTLHLLGSTPLDHFLKLDDHFTAGNVGGALLLLDALVRQGKDLRQFVRDYLAHLRDLLLTKVHSGDSVLDLTAQALEALKSRAAAIQQTHILGAIKLFGQLENDMRYSASPRLLVEVALIRVAGLYGAAAENAVEPVVQPVSVKKPGGTGVEPALIPSTNDLPERPSVVQLPPKEPTGESVSLPAEKNQVTQVWDQIVDMVKKVRPSTHTLLLQTKVGPVRGNSVVLIASNTAFANLLKRSADIQIVEKALAKVGLTGLEIQVVDPSHALAKTVPGGASVSSTQRPERERTLLDVAQSVFPKDLVQEVKEEGSK